MAKVNKSGQRAEGKSLPIPRGRPLWTGAYLVPLAMLCYEMSVTCPVVIVGVTINQTNTAVRLRHSDGASQISEVFVTQLTTRLSSSPTQLADSVAFSPTDFTAFFRIYSAQCSLSVLLLVASSKEVLFYPAFLFV